jgi:hypothetical protein
LPLSSVDVWATALPPAPYAVTSAPASAPPVPSTVPVTSPPAWSAASIPETVWLLSTATGVAPARVVAPL